MNTLSIATGAPRLLAVDDERPIHASLRLRLSKVYELTCCSDPREALARITRERFDLGIVDLHMPEMDGLDFVEAARRIDPALGFVILSGNGTEENLRRTIPLQIYDFVYKPLPDLASFDLRIPEWIERTRKRRGELAAAESSDALSKQLDATQLERDIEFTASESARDALLQSANLLTTVTALLASASYQLSSRTRQEPSLSQIERCVQEARKAAEAAAIVSEGFFNTAYSNRDSSPAHLGECLTNAVSICSRWTRADQDRKTVDVSCLEKNAIIQGLSGLELLLLLVPALGAALEITEPGTTVQVRAEGTEYLDDAQKSARALGFLWIRRKQALRRHAGMLISIRAANRAFSADEVRQWLEGNPGGRVRSPVRGLLHGLEKCQGMAGFAVEPNHHRFELMLVLPTKA